MPHLKTTRPGMIRLRSTTIAVVLLAGILSSGAAAAAEPASELWRGTWNAPNLWRAVELTVRRGAPARSTFAIGTARDKTPAAPRSFAIDDTSLVAEIEYAGTVVQLDGAVRGERAEGRLRVVRGEGLLTEGIWTLERGAPSDLTVDVVLERVRAALNFPGALAAGYTVEESPAPADGAVPAPGPAWSARVGSRGEIAVDENGDPSLIHDGGRVWMNRAPFGWMPADVRMQEKTLLAEVVRSGGWLLPGSRLKYRTWIAGVGSERRYVVEITTAAGVVPARVLIDPADWLPESAAVAWDAGDRTFRFAEYAEQGGSLFPGRITAGYRGKQQEWRTTRVAPGGGEFAAPVAEGVRYDTGSSPVLPGTHGAGEAGHLFVRPVVAGRDVGWFHVDTGAPFLILDTQVADELGLKVVRAMGPRSVRRIPEIRIGQLILTDQPVLVQDLSNFSAPDSTRRAGVIGGPAFEHALVVFDYSGKQLSVCAPEAFHEAVPTWQPLGVEGPPVIDATFDGVPARFFLDTGKSGTVSFVSHAAARNGLYAERKLEEATNETVEGSTTELVTHIASFTVAGRRFDAPEVRIKLPGTTNDEIGTMAGIIGRPFFKDRRVVFDYMRGRIGFLPGRR